MKGQHLSLGLTAILVTSAVAIGSYGSFSSKRSPSPAPAITEKSRSRLPRTNAAQVITESQDQPVLAPQTAEIPKHIVYGLLFREAAAFRQKAKELKDHGKDASSVEGFHAKRAKLRGDQAEVFERIASECQRKVDEIEEQAKKIIEKDRAQHPGGKLKPGESLPEPPKQLQELENHRRAVIMKGRDDLRAAMGASEFQRFEEFEERDVAERAKSVGRPPHAVTPPVNGFKPKP
jgi:hypothetical protein